MKIPAGQLSIFALGLACMVSPAQAAPDTRLKAAAEQASRR